ncbi:MAG: YggN family protein [Psychrosphaera sp.]|nr:YggN family protein [Psychrosphaera sp.]
MNSIKITKIIPAALFMATVALSSSAFAHDNESNYKYGSSKSHSSMSNDECSIDLHNGVTVTPKFVKVFDSNDTLFRIEKNGAMSVDGKSVNLPSSQQKISADYDNGLRDVVPQAVDIAVNAMENATVGVNTAFTALFGENSDIEYKVNQIIEKTKDEINANINHSGDEYTIGPNSFDNLENAFDEDFEKEIEKVAMSSMGSIFSLLGDAMSNGSGDFEQRMEAFGERMEKMGEELETTMEAHGEQLEEQAEALCKQLKEVDELETQLQEQVPQFAKYELLDMDSKRSHRNRHHDEDSSED